MKKDKEETKSDPSILCASFDQQKVLTTPRSEISVMYYRRKISYFNFTIFNLSTKEGECSVSDETLAK